VIEAKSVEELECLQEQAISLAKTSGVPVCCDQQFKLKPNDPCLCGSKKKWKKCCMWESRTSVTFYPDGYLSRPKKSKLAGLMAFAAVQGWIGNTLRS
jgi:hypothetical protein